MASAIKTPPWYVVTGAPYSGISTLVGALRRKPQISRTYPEVATAIISENLARGISVEETRRDPLVFEYRILGRKLAIEAQELVADTREAPKGRVCVFERGVPDSMAYFKLGGLDTSGMVRKNLAINRYRAAFFLEPLEYKRGGIRLETPEERDVIGELLLVTYKDLGYEVITIPVMPVEERADTVMQHIADTL
ncbi:MAG: ATP-binding protein [Candidatus Micrarchaeota archaeon]|nr:ATP-binding protein [Candidatus Micrarchaeota archaeon]MDE1833959.1 ATP-binding protein [Candidatus Micrarchaeota archaeon]MDE1859773.1 ATP-binding protein [Candidatus Micrarchaeota archaeon]